MRAALLDAFLQPSNYEIYPNSAQLSRREALKMPLKAFSGLLPLPADTSMGKPLVWGAARALENRHGFGAKPRCSSVKDLAKVTPTLSVGL